MSLVGIARAISISYGGTNETVNIPDASTNCIISGGGGITWVSFASLGLEPATYGEEFNGTATLVGGEVVQFVGTFF
jgi:hypothetical protein